MSYPMFKDVKSKIEELDGKTFLNVSMDIQASIYDKLILDGYIMALKDLRKLSKEYRHQAQWNHSRDPVHAPVELSDWLLINKINPMKKKLGLK